MESLGPHFQIEVNKFKFLNELIRLVSKKFLGDRTPKEIQDRILDILFTWTDKYPELSKIKEAYTMLRNQGVVHEPQKNVIAKSSKKSTDSTLKLIENEKFKRLLQSKNQKDIEAANLMIQNMVRDNDRRCQMLNRRLIDLQSGNTNAILLKQMLDELDPSEGTEDTLATLQEIYSHCVKLRPTVTRLMDENYESESFSQIQETYDSINSAIELYTAIIIDKKHTPAKKKTETKSSNLLDVAEAVTDIQTNSYSELNDIFSSSTSKAPPTQVDNLLLETQPMPQNSNNIDIMALINKHKASADLMGNFDTPQTPTKVNEDKPKPLSELDSLVTGMKTKLLATEEETKNVQRNDSEDDVQNLIDDDVIIFKTEEAPKIELTEQKIALKDINLDIADIQPSEIEAPRTILDEKKGLKVVVNFTQDRPAKDVIVIVITVINQGPIAITNFQFDASVTKPCKLRILEASDTKLPGLKPFKPPTDTINQVLLLLNPTQEPIDMVAILTYNMQDDPDPYKESIAVKDIPFNS
jgi:ADP-ribosylation factor-binding protein GGA